MRFLLLIVISIMSACGPGNYLEPTEVHYRITPENNGFWVEIKSNGWGPIVGRPSSNSTLSHYELNRKHDYSTRYFVVPKSDSKFTQATIMEMEHGFFQAVGHSLLACIGTQYDHKKQIQIEWNVPNNWKLVNSFSAQDRTQHFLASCKELNHSLFAGGLNLNLKETEFGALIVSGNLSLSMSELEQTISKNMETIRKFWEAEKDPYFFVSVRGINNHNQHSSGTGHHQAFQIAIPQNSSKSTHLDNLIMHEYVHHWIGNSKLNIEQDHLNVWWFVEGFTDFISYWKSYDAVGQAKDYIHSEIGNNFQNMPLERLKQHYDDSEAYFKFPYKQGKHIAIMIWNEIKKHAKYLGTKKKFRHFMQDIVARSERDKSFILTNDNIVKVLCEGDYMPCDLAQEIIQKYVIKGEQFPTGLFL